MTTFTTKLPARGDKVIDKSRVIKQEGHITSGVFDPTPSIVPLETIKDAFVAFSTHDHAWYTVAQLQDRWSEEQQAYIIEED